MQTYLELNQNKHNYVTYRSGWITLNEEINSNVFFGNQWIKQERNKWSRKCFSRSVTRVWFIFVFSKGWTRRTEKWPPIEARVGINAAGVGTPIGIMPMGIGWVFVPRSAVRKLRISVSPPSLDLTLSAVINKHHWAPESCATGNLSGTEPIINYCKWLAVSSSFGNEENRKPNRRKRICQPFAPPKGLAKLKAEPRHRLF